MFRAESLELLASCRSRPRKEAVRLNFKQPLSSPEDLDDNPVPQARRRAFPLLWDVLQPWRRAYVIGAGPASVAQPLRRVCYFRLRWRRRFGGSFRLVLGGV